MGSSKPIRGDHKVELLLYKHPYKQFSDLRKLPVIARMLATSGAERAQEIVEMTSRMRELAIEFKKRKGVDATDYCAWANFHWELGGWFIWIELLQELARSKCSFSADQANRVLTDLAEYTFLSDFSHRYLPTLWRSLTRSHPPSSMDMQSQNAIKKIAAALSRGSRAAEQRLSRQVLTSLDSSQRLNLPKGEAWAEYAARNLTAQGNGFATHWNQFLKHCRAATGAAPTPKWLAELRRLRKGIARKQFVAGVRGLLDCVDMPRTNDPSVHWRWAGKAALYLSDDGQAVLKGICWACNGVKDSALARSLGATALSGLKRVPGVGPRAVSVGNAAIWALGQIPGPDALGQLAMLRVKVKFIPAQKAIEKALTAAAKREGLPRAEIEELGVPTYGLTEVGVRREELGDTIVELAATGGDVSVRFFKKAVGKDRAESGATNASAVKGKEIKSAPASVKNDFADDLKELKASAKDLASMLSAQRDRIDSMFLDNRSWPLEAWRERYLDHPVVGVIARRLIWSIGDARTSVIFSDGSLVDRLGRPVDPPSDATVRLWHPVDAPADEVLAWRRFVEEKQIRQPFKQAHREVYLLTDAERRTNTYSNRFAAHIVRQHQFHALCGQRNWRNRLRLFVDGEFPPPTKHLPQYGMRAEFWVQEAGEETLDSGAFVYLATDQVRFYRAEAGQITSNPQGGGFSMTSAAPDQEPIALENVPALVLSEILRDCDLFVGVASVGNNPAWNDGGPGQFRDYWQSYSFGDLSATAQTRRDLLSRLVPRLKIAERCSLSDRFLIVRGHIRTYKIHLGSGNILMEPNDQYLCIVPSSSGSVGGAKSAGASGVFLPFEGDRTLSIILSKAFMLAADDAITDTTITRQIQHG